MTAEVGGVLSGLNPFHYNPSSPLTLFLFQTCLILITCNLVHIPMAKIRQPKVVSEIVAGIILGPTVFGQIPNYTKTVFPEDSLSGLTLTANIGIIFFMFFLGLEVETSLIRRHLKAALSLGISTLAVPFGFGCLLAIPLFHSYANIGLTPSDIDSDDVETRYVKFSVYMVFIAVSISVTAFPVLCRILSELSLIKERVGIVVLCAGAINDIFGWILLALSVILSNSESNPVNTVYILLCALGWFLLYFYPVKYCLRWILIRTNELSRSQPSLLATTGILFMMFISAYFTDIIGIHAIFGAFIAGLIVPRDNNYMVKLTERMEDIPHIVLIPIYFAVAGLNVDLTLLDDGKDWGYIVLSILIAVVTKVVAGAVVGRMFKLFWREALTSGVLLSCKGIVEVVVLSVGLNSGIISQKIFGMFILMALVSTFVTTPLTMLCYPESYRKQIQIQDAALGSKTEGDEESSDSSSEIDDKKDQVVVREAFAGCYLQSFSTMFGFKIHEIVTVLNTTETLYPALDLLNYLVCARDRSGGSSQGPAAHPVPEVVVKEVESPELQKVHTHQSNSLSKTLSNTSGFRNKTNAIKTFFAGRNNSSKTVAITDSESDMSIATACDAHTDMEYPISLRALHMKHLAERPTYLLQASLNNDNLGASSHSGSLLGILSIFAYLSGTPFSSDVIYTTMKEKADNVANIKAGVDDLLLVPLNGAQPEYEYDLDLTERFQDFEHLLSHILGLNELPHNFFQSMASLNTNVALLVSNTDGGFPADGSDKKAFNLLLPNPNLTNSDFLALYIFLLVYYRAFRYDHQIDVTIFVNSKFFTFADSLCESFQFNERLPVPNIVYVETESQSGSESASFAKTVLTNYMTEEALDNLEKTTFVIAESNFDRGSPFSSETKETLLEGSRRGFNTMIVHHSHDLGSSVEEL